MPDQQVKTLILYGKSNTIYAGCFLVGNSRLEFYCIVRRSLFLTNLSGIGFSWGHLLYYMNSQPTCVWVAPVGRCVYFASLLKQCIHRSLEVIKRILLLFFSYLSFTDCRLHSWSSESRIHCLRLKWQMLHQLILIQLWPDLYQGVQQIL